MADFLKEVIKRTSVFVIVAGATLLVIGASGNITIGTFALKFSDYLGRAILSGVGVLLIVFGVYHESAEKPGLVFLGFGPKRTYFPEPRLISSDKKNQRKIDSQFLFWEKCTIMMWVLVPPEGEGLRDSPDYRFLLGHHTGRIEDRYAYYNQFSLHRNSENAWEVTFSNNEGEYTSSPLLIADRLDTGWHHFLVAWDRSSHNSELVFAIDGGRRNDISKSTDCWPERLEDKVCVGAWMNDWHGNYCETKLYQLLIFDDFLEVTDSATKKHLKQKPRTR